MMNCAERVETMSLHEYESRLYHWNEAHDSKDDDVEPPDAETAMKLLALANSDPRLTH